MRKTRADSVIGSLPEETRDAIYERVSRLSLKDALGVLTASESEGGFGIQIGRTALAEWLAGERLLRFGARLRKGREVVESLAKDAQGSDRYDPVLFAALKENLLDHLAAGSLTPEDAQKLGGLILADRKLTLDEKKHASAEKLGGKKLALQEKQLQARIRELEQKIAAQQFDAAKAVLAHAKEIRLVMADNTADAAAKIARVQQILWGDKPADFQPVAAKGEESES